MADVFTKEKRSEIMARITSRNTKPEVLVRKYLFAHGFRYRINDKRLPGKPDIYLPKYKAVVFVNGCFWHGHSDCKAGKRLPSSNVEYWTEKIRRNRERDRKVWQELEEKGLRVFVVWECQLKKKTREEVLGRLAEEIRNPGANSFAPILP